jgi:hypothetical protein
VEDGFLQTPAEYSARKKIAIHSPLISIFSIGTKDDQTDVLQFAITVLKA